MKALHYQTQKEQNNLEERLTQEEVCQYFTNLRPGSLVRFRGKNGLAAEPPSSEEKSLFLGPLAAQNLPRPNSHKLARSQASTSLL